MSGRKLAYLVMAASLTVLIMAGCTPEYEVELQADPEDAGEIKGEGTYEEGEEVTVEAKTKDDYEFEKWEKDGEETDEESFEFEIEEDTEIVANFREILASDDIPDDNLKEVIREELGIEGEITREDLKDLTSLKARGENITSLKGLEYAKNLGELSVEENEINDIRVLKNLSNFGKLSACEKSINPEEQFEIITELQLYELDLNDIKRFCAIDDLELEDLNEIFFEGEEYLKETLGSSKDTEIDKEGFALESANAVYDVKKISPLKSLPELETLRLIDNPIDDTDIINKLESQDVYVTDAAFMRG